MAVDPNLFLPAYRAGEGGPGPAIQSGLEGFVAGRKLSIQQQQIQMLQALNAARANLANTHAERYQDLIDNPAQNYKQVGTNADGTPRYVDTKTGEEISGAPGLTPSVGKGVSGIANARLANLMGRNSPLITQNANLISLGQRIEGLTSAPDIVKDPDTLKLAQDLILRQASGVGATVAGLQMLQNETPQQFLSRVVTKITNQPEDAGTKSFMNQIQAQSRNDVNTGIRNLRAAIVAPAEAEATLYDSQGDKTTADAIRNGAQNYYKTFIKNSTGKDFSDDDLNDPTGLAISHPELKKLMASPSQDKSPQALAAAQQPTFPGLPAPSASQAAPATPPPSIQAPLKTKSGISYQVVQ